MTMRLQADTLRDEIEQIQAILTRWQDKLGKGVPGDDIPAGREIDEEIFKYQLRGELQLCSERLGALVDVLEG